VARESDFGEALVAIGLGILGGIALAAILEGLSKPKCPECYRPINSGVPVCPYCHTVLRWN